MRGNILKRNVYFFIGTEAELIKLFPVIIECQNKGNICHIIASGQNDLNRSRIMKEINLTGKYVELSKEEDIRKSAVGLLEWFICTKRKSLKIIKSNFKSEDLEGAPMVVHGDTVSTFMGAWIGKQLKCIVCHVEAGLRSHNLLNPFPEEIDRLLTSNLARVHFAPGKEPVENLKRVKGKVVNTEYNTILDSLKYSKTMPIATEAVKSVLSEKYFVFVMHRQENLASKEFVNDVVARVKKYSKKMKCVLILHKITENTFAANGILDELEKDEQFVLLPRVDYFDFMKLLDGAQYVITDGGSNQEELHYMGKPCMIMRKTTERQEGIGQNAILFGGKLKNVDNFVSDYSKYETPSLIESNSPSKMIASVISKIAGKYRT